MDMILDECKYLTSTCWNENYQLLSKDMTKDKYTRRKTISIRTNFNICTR